MQMKKETPGTAINALLTKHGLNYSSLAKAIGVSSAMVRLIALDQNPVSAPIAFRLAKFFKTSPEYWLDLQTARNVSETAQDKKLAKEIKDITTVDKFAAKPSAKPGRKPKTEKTGKKGRAVKDAKKPAGKRGRPAKSGKAKAGPTKGTPVKAAKTAAVKRGRPAGKKAAAVKPAAKNVTLVKTAKPTVKKAPSAEKAKPTVKARPAAKEKAVIVNPQPAVTEIRPAAPPPQPVNQPDGTVNEPRIN